nr:MAG TPA: hypothetical protein [Caudoviricetes sp.]
MWLRCWGEPQHRNTPARVSRRAGVFLCPAWDTENPRRDD